MASTTPDSYYLPEPSRWPITASLSVFVLLFGVVLWVNGQGAGPWIMLAGAALLVYLFKGWFGQVIHENLTGCYGGKVDRSFRQGMFWFITSEVFFFLTFFGCLYYLRTSRCPTSAVTAGSPRRTSSGRASSTPGRHCNCRMRATTSRPRKPWARWASRCSTPSSC